MTTKKRLLYSLWASALFLTACSDSGEDVVSYADDAQAIHFSTGVARATRAAATPEYLPVGSTVSLSESYGSGYVPYVVRNEAGDLEPTTTAFLRWKKSSITTKVIYACSPAGMANQFELRPDQSTAELFTAADYLTFAGTVVRNNADGAAATATDDPNAVIFTFSHRLARVNITLKRGSAKGGTSSATDAAGNAVYKYDGCTFDMTLYSRGSGVWLDYSEYGTDEDATTYNVAPGATTDQYSAMTATVHPNNTSTTAIKPLGGTAMTFDATASAIVVPTTAVAESRFIALQPKRDGENVGSTLYLLGVPTLKTGYTYDFELTVEDDAIYINAVQVTVWDENSDVLGDDASSTANWYTINLDEYDDFDAVKSAVAAVAPWYKKLRFTGALKDNMTYSYFNGLGGGSYPTTHLDISGVTGATEISSYDFSGCTLQEIYLPNSVTKIGYRAFSGCTSLSYVKFPASLSSIANYAFYGCTSLTSLESSTLTSVGSYAFTGCTSLVTLNIPAATYVADRSFQQCSSLVNVYLPQVTYLGVDAFKLCSSMEVLYLPEATYLGWWNAGNDYNLKLVVTPKVSSIEEHFWGEDSVESFHAEWVVSSNLKSKFTDNTYYPCITHTYQHAPTMKSVTIVGSDGLVESSSRAGVTEGMSWRDIDFGYDFNTGEIKSNFGVYPEDATEDAESSTDITAGEE
jgi:hypothetical protein